MTRFADDLLGTKQQNTQQDNCKMQFTLTGWAQQGTGLWIGRAAEPSGISMQKINTCPQSHPSAQDSKAALTGPGEGYWENQISSNAKAA
jgi:hypothetical protein